MVKWLHAAAVALFLAGSAHADLKLVAQYDWIDGAKDVSGSPIHHDGVLDPAAFTSAGKLFVHGWDGVSFGNVPEIDNATQLLFRFENVTFTQFGSSGSNPASNYPILAGDGMQWWLAVEFTLLPQGSQQTRLAFNLGGYATCSFFETVVANAIVDHFDSLEYRLDTTVPLDQRFAIRWNDGPWMIGGLGDPHSDRILPTTDFRFNNGAPADWDPMWGSIGPVSIYSNAAIPEPTCGLLPVASLLLLIRTPRSRTQPLLI